MRDLSLIVLVKVVDIPWRKLFLADHVQKVDERGAVRAVWPSPGVDEVATTTTHPPASEDRPRERNGADDPHREPERGRAGAVRLIGKNGDRAQGPDVRRIGPADSLSAGTAPR